MGKMKELYEKVANDSALQAKFNAIINDAEKAGEAVTGEKLMAFAKDAGFEVTLDEMKEFFKELAEKSKDELSEVELDMVAGGKSVGGIFTVIGSVVTLGGSCAGIALASNDTRKYTGHDDCSNVYN